MGGQRDQPPGVVVKVHPVLTPIVAIGRDGEFTPPQRVDGMSDLERLVATLQIGCT
jgi:hypothetical protein